MLDIDPLADAPARATPVATPVPKPRRGRSRPEDRPLITDDYVREIIANGNQLDLPNVVRDGTGAARIAVGEQCRGLACRKRTAYFRSRDQSMT